MNQKERGKMNGIEQIKAERERCSGILKELIKRKKHLDAYVWQERIGGLDFALSVLEERKGSEICWDMLEFISELEPPLPLIFNLYFIESKSFCYMAAACQLDNKAHEGNNDAIIAGYIHEIEKRLDEYFK